MFIFGLQVVVVPYLVIDLFTTVPLHNGVQRRTQESSVPVSLVLSAVGHRVRDITEYLEPKMIHVYEHSQCTWSDTQNDTCIQTFSVQVIRDLHIQLATYQIC